MCAQQSKNLNSNFVEILTSDKSAIVIGYRIGGSNTGPNIWVTGSKRITTPIYECLLRLPTLPWMRGTIYLMNLGVLDQNELSKPPECVTNETIDDFLFLPFDGPPENTDIAVRAGYRSILQLCTQLGMISGRGISQRSQNRVN